MQSPHGAVDRLTKAGETVGVTGLLRPPFRECLSTSDFLTIRWIGSWEKPVPWPRLWSRTRSGLPEPGHMPPGAGPEHLRRHETADRSSKSISHSAPNARGVCNRFPYYQLGREGGAIPHPGGSSLRIVMGFSGGMPTVAFRCRCRPLRPMRRVCSATIGTASIAPSRSWRARKPSDGKRRGGRSASWGA